MFLRARRGSCENARHREKLGHDVNVPITRRHTKQKSYAILRLSRRGSANTHRRECAHKFFFVSFFFSVFRVSPLALPIAHTLSHSPRRPPLLRTHNGRLYYDRAAARSSSVTSSADSPERAPRILGGWKVGSWTEPSVRSDRVGVLVRIDFDVARMYIVPKLHRPQSRR